MNVTLKLGKATGEALKALVGGEAPATTSKGADVARIGNRITFVAKDGPRTGVVMALMNKTHALVEWEHDTASLIPLGAFRAAPTDEVGAAYPAPSGGDGAQVERLEQTDAYRRIQYKDETWVQTGTNYKASRTRKEICAEIRRRLSIAGLESEVACQGEHVFVHLQSVPFRVYTEESLKLLGQSNSSHRGYFEVYTQQAYVLKDRIRQLVASFHETRGHRRFLSLKSEPVEHVYFDASILEHEASGASIEDKAVEIPIVIG